MEHNDLATKMEKAIGGFPPLGLRERWAQFRQEEATEFYLPYNVIKDNRFLQWIYECPEVDFGCGAEGVTVFITKYEEGYYDDDSIKIGQSRVST